jgi:8-oxo-dGTP diphosphatase
MSVPSRQDGIEHIGVAVVFLCHDGAGHYLFAQRGPACRDEQGAWDCGGGALEFGDRVENTLHRELAEEYGTEVVDIEFLGYRDVHREHNGVPTHWVALDFKVQVDPDLVRNNEPHKFSNIGWYSLDTLPSPLHSQLPAFFRKYEDRL